MKKKVVLLLQGGGALGAFQCGAWEAISRFLRDNDHELLAITGASIGAINAGLIARHIHDDDAGVGALRRFWHGMVATSPAPFFPFPGEYWRAWNGLMTGLLLGNRALFFPVYANWTPAGDMFRFRLPPYRTDSAERILAQAFGEYRGEDPLLAIGLTDVETGEGVLFDSARRTITARLLAACISIPILFAPAEIDGRYYWDFEVRSDTLVPSVSELVRNRLRDGREVEELLFIVVDMFHASAGKTPTSALESHYRLVNILLGERLERDARAVEAGDTQVDALERLEKLAADDPPSSRLAAAVRAEYQRALEKRRMHIELLHIGREPFSYEYISRDFDYSPQYLARLDAQGFDNASAVLGQYQEKLRAESQAGHGSHFSFGGAASSRQLLT